MGVIPWSSVLLLLASLILALLVNENEAIKCYICSWSPHDNRNDTCTSGKFIPEYALVHDCEKGCETVSMRDGNGELEMFYRNCFSKGDSGHDYIKRKNGINEEELYKCDWKLCNGATPVFFNSAMLVVLIAAVQYTWSTFQ